MTPMTEHWEAMANLIGADSARRSFDGCVLLDYIKLEKHPFGLWLPEVGSRPEPFFGKISLLGYPNYTDQSVNAMLAVIRSHIACFPGGIDPRPQLLRIIYAPVDEDRTRNYVLFEFCGWQGDVICGGCTDHSGAGAEGKRQLEGCFRFLSSLYGVKINEIRLRPTTAIAGWRWLTDEYNNRDTLMVV